MSSLGARERQVIARVSAGKLNKQIAADLGLSEVTVKVHRANAMRKMRATSLSHLIKMLEHVEQCDMTSTVVRNSDGLNAATWRGSPSPVWEANGQSLRMSIHAKIQRRPMANVLTEDEARRIASNIAKLPDLTQQRRLTASASVGAIC